MDKLKKLLRLRDPSEFYSEFYDEDTKANVKILVPGSFKERKVWMITFIREGKNIRKIYVNKKDYNRITLDMVELEELQVKVDKILEEIKAIDKMDK